MSFMYMYYNYDYNYCRNGNIFESVVYFYFAYMIS